MCLWIQPRFMVECVLGSMSSKVLLISMVLKVQLLHLQWERIIEPIHIIASFSQKLHVLIILNMINNFVLWQHNTSPYQTIHVSFRRSVVSSQSPVARHGCCVRPKLPSFCPRLLHSNPTDCGPNLIQLPSISHCDSTAWAATQIPTDSQILPLISKVFIFSRM